MKKNLEKYKGKRYWSVCTQQNDEWGREYLIGNFYGTLTEIALHLTKKAQGFYMSHGVLIFYPAEETEEFKINGDRVNIQVKAKPYSDVLSKKDLKEIVEGTGAHIEDSNYYDCEYLVKD